MCARGMPRDRATEGPSSLTFSRLIRLSSVLTLLKSWVRPDSFHSEGLLALYRAAKTTDEKRELLRTLTMIDGDAALEAIDAALEGKK